MSEGKVFQLVKEGDIGVVTIDVPGAVMNTWTQQAVEDFCELVETLEKASDMAGVVFVSGKRGNFHAGANLNMLDQMKDRDATAHAIDIFHSAFQRLNELTFPTVAAIDGHCLGGGLEFALACTARIAKDSKGTVLGLPECTLGIFPGGGGTQRLPRLIGYPAIELILRGKVLPASRAYEMGIVDRLVPKDGDIREEGIAFLKGIINGTEELTRKEHDFSQIDNVADMARQEVLKVTRGREIPGPMLALESIRNGMKVPLREGLEIEKNNFVDAVLTDQAKGSIHTFFLKTMSDKPRALVSKGFEAKPLNKIAILGFGTMGRGIAIDVLRNMQVPLIVKDIAPALESGKGFVRKIFDGMAQKKRLKSSVDDLMSRLTLTSEYTDDFKVVDLVIEAVFEDIKIKEQVYGEICGAVRDDCIIASNTSSIPLDAMAPYVTHPERFGGAHFFSPVWLMQLVEIISGEKTARETADNLVNFAAAIRKRPLVCKDNPGFVVNAVLFPYFIDALEFAETGNSIED
ncbi:MAG: 3-hydroxyacyl-CoA dehydrogenase NAD-binding domain-containing protein, partial [Deltaproteobacteria bacterium]